MIEDKNNVQTSSPSPLLPWVMRAHSNPQARLRLFCFPYAGGGASIFYPWSRYLPTAVEICPVQLPGREQRLREPLFTELSPLIQTLIQQLQPYLDLPFAFFGHSFGALLSFELSRALRRLHAPLPCHLFASGCPAPHVLDLDPPLHKMPNAELLAEIRRRDGTPAAILENPELMQILLPIVRADYTIYKTYVYFEEAPLDCTISAFGGLEDDMPSRNELAAWRIHTRHSLTLRMVPGNHFFINSARAQLLQYVSEDLRRKLGSLDTLGR